MFPRVSAVLFRTWRPALAGPVAALIILAAGCGRDSGSTRVVNIVTAPPGGSWYVIGGTLASIINDAVPGVQAVAEVSGGAEENVRLVGTGQSNLGFVISKTALQGYQGQPPFSQPFPNLRMVLSNLDIGRINVVALEGSPLEDVCDLKARRVGVGPSGHGSLANLREIFSAGCGFTFDDITPIYLPYDQALSALGDGRIDAAVLYVSPPIPAISEFGATRRFRLLPLTEAARDAVVAKYPYYLKTTIPAGAYTGITAAIPVVGTSNGLMVSADLSADLVYQITKATFDHLERFRGSYPTIAGFTLEVAPKGGLIPYHEGAIRYYRERAVWPEAGSATH
jgi:TRAP transporter TAXI family solute receptor